MASHEPGRRRAGGYGRRWVTRVQHLLIVVLTAFLPPGDGSRWREEWRRLLEDTPRGLRLRELLSMLRGAPDLAAARWACWFRQRAGTAGISITEASDRLAEAARQQWLWEASRRQLAESPLPLPVRMAAGTPGPQCPPDNWDTLAGMFEHVSSRRLVVLGEPGAGKTILAIRFTLDLLAGRTSDQPVPVIFPLASWAPGSPLTGWMTDWLARNYPAVASRATARSAVFRELVTSGHVLPVLDGLDEISAAHRAAAVAAINNCPALQGPLVLTSRAEDFLPGLPGEALPKDVMVAELTPPTFENVARYLSQPAQRTTRDGNPCQKWGPVLTRLRQDPAHPLRRALSSPCMAYLSFLAYIDPDANPSELLDITRFPDPRAAILDRLIARGCQRHPAGQATVQRWLHFLAQKPAYLSRRHRNLLTDPRRAFTRAALASRGLLPLRLERFLRYAHRYGLMRRTGRDYEFAHMLVRDYLLENGGTATSRKARSTPASACTTAGQRPYSSSEGPVPVPESATPQPPPDPPETGPALLDLRALVLLLMAGGAVYVALRSPALAAAIGFGLFVLATANRLLRR